MNLKITATIALAVVAASTEAQMPYAVPTQAKTQIQSRARVNQNEVVSEVEGVVTYYRLNTLGWYIYAGGNNLMFGEIPGASKVVRPSDEPDVLYIYNPLTADARNSYIRCTIEGNKLRAQFPQTLAYLEDGKGYFPLYIGKMNAVTDDQGTTYMPEEDPEKNFYTWTIYEDGTIIMDGEDVKLTPSGNFADKVPDHILGTYYYTTGVDGSQEPFWNGVGDWAQTFTVVEVEPIVPMPTDLEVEQWQMTSVKQTRMVDVVIEDDTFYMGRLTPYGEGALVGRIEDDKVIFPTLQNLGFYDKTNANVYFIATTASYGSWDFGDYVMTFLDHFNWKDEMVFAYDRVNQILTPTVENQCILINAYTDQVGLYEYIEEPKFTYLPPKGMNAAPQDPEIIVPGRYEGFESGYYFEFELPKVNVDGITLNTDRMTYNIYLNGELTTFYNDQYYYMEVDELTDIPYSFSDRNHDFTVRGTTHYLQLHSEGISTIGVQSNFLGYDGVLYQSAIVTGTTSTALAVPSADAWIISEHFYDLQGREIPKEKTTKGLVLKRTEYSDGTVCTRKILRR